MLDQVTTDTMSILPKRWGLDLDWAVSGLNGMLDRMDARVAADVTPEGLYTLTYNTCFSSYEVIRNLVEMFGFQVYVQPEEGSAPRTFTVQGDLREVAFG